MKLVNLLSDRDYFYLMHLSWGANNRRREMWNFARERSVIGLDRSDVEGDWTQIRDRAEEHLRSVNSYKWIKQFDMFCEEMNPDSMTDGDIVVVMAGKEHLLGICEVIGPHNYNIALRLGKTFFDHTRPVRWITSYDYDSRKRISRIEFQNTLKKVEKSNFHDETIWSTLSGIDLETTVRPTPAVTKADNSQILEELKNIQTDLTKETSKVSRYKRSGELVEKLKALYDYQCQLCSTTFSVPSIPMLNGHNYVEVHHIKGFNETANTVGANQENADFIIDNYKNTITVCPYHHKLLHKHKNQFYYDTIQKCFVSQDKSTKLLLAINNHL